jgi:hypothetical protein
VKLVILENDLVRNKCPYQEIKIIKKPHTHSLIRLTDNLSIPTRGPGATLFT